ncbi:MAG: acyl-CoA dehydrogenase [Candidatus Eisenbacteria bacterium]|nr:acyl-CoA dehydrogenase [Candidatus Latescibacterota bacterium]MBD3303224.1 acyl-CoA dehydrogenase [Candidatus Eisenbacteria bacterium]
MTPPEVVDTLADEERMIVEMVRDFAANELEGIAREIDAEKRVPLDAIEKMRELGLFGLLIPEEFGGSEVRTIVSTRVIEELSKVCAAVAITVSVHNSVGAFPILLFGSDEQKKRFLPRLASEMTGAFCLSEADAGSDAASLKLRARRDGDAWVLDGTKMWVTNATQAGIFLVFARSDPDPSAGHRGITAFLVEKDAPGLSVSKLEDKMGLRASDTAELAFESVRVSDSHRLGAEGDGFKVAMSALDNGRIGVGAQALGIARAAFDEALRYAKERQQFGQPISRFEGIRLMLAQMDTEIQTAALLVYRAAAMKDAGLPYGPQASMAKLYASEAATRVTHAAVQIHGGYGYVKEYAVERYYRDARVTEIYEGTSQMQRIVIARSLLGKQKRATA